MNSIIKMSKNRILFYIVSWTIVMMLFCHFFLKLLWVGAFLGASLGGVIVGFFEYQLQKGLARRPPK